MIHCLYLSAFLCVLHLSPLVEHLRLPVGGPCLCARTLVDNGPVRSLWRSLYSVNKRSQERRATIGHQYAARRLQNFRWFSTNSNLSLQLRCSQKCCLLRDVRPAQRSQPDLASVNCELSRTFINAQAVLVPLEFTTSSTARCSGPECLFIV